MLGSCTINRTRHFDAQSKFLDTTKLRIHLFATRHFADIIIPFRLVDLRQYHLRWHKHTIAILTDTQPTGTSLIGNNLSVVELAKVVYACAI